MDSMRQAAPNYVKNLAKQAMVQKYQKEFLLRIFELWVNYIQRHTSRKVFRASMFYKFALEELSRRKDFPDDWPNVKKQLKEIWKIKEEEKILKRCSENSSSFTF